MEEKSKSNVEASERKLQKTSKQSKKKGKKSYSTERVFRFFNKIDHKNVRKDLLKELNIIADRYKVKHVNLENNLPYKNWLARDWSWNSSFFIKYLEKYEDTVDYVFIPHYRFWLDQLIDQCSHMIWNLVYKTYFLEWKETGIIPKNTLSRKLRNSIETVAGDFADKEVEIFKEKFR